MNRLPRPTRVLAGTLVLPMLLGVLVLWSMGDRAERADRVPAAVVNLDRPVTTKAGGKEQVVYAGRLLAGGLTSPTSEDDTSLGWELASAEQARKGLADGDFYAVVTIPRDFSATLSKISGRDARQAGVTLQTNDASSAVVGEASKQVTTVAAARLGQTITSTYLQGVNQQTGALKTRLGDAADGAGQLADGSQRLRSGATQLGGGADELAAGLDELGTGADRLAAGGRRLTGGAEQLQDGTGRLADGLGTLSRRTDPLPGQTRQLADGARQVDQGVGPYTQVVKGWAQVCAANPVVAGTNPQLCAGTIRAAGPGGRNADRLAAGSAQLASGADRLADGTPRLTSAIDRSADGARQLDRGTGRLVDGSRQLAGGAARLADGAEQASAGADRLAAGSTRLADGTTRLTSGSEELASGLDEGAEQVPAPSERQAQVVADPVATAASTLNPERDGRTLLLPVVLAIALLLGAFVTSLVRRPLPAGRLRDASGAVRLALAGWLPALAIGAVQAALLYAVTLALGADVAAPVGVAALLVLVAAVFAAVSQAFVALLGQRRGWIASIAFAAVQVVSLGGLVPIDTAPAPFQALNAVLPLARAADGLNHLVLGGDVGSPGLDVVLLAGWGLLALALTSYAARRAQVIDPLTPPRLART